MHYSNLSMGINAKSIFPDNGAEYKTRMRSESPINFCASSSLFQFLFHNLTIREESIPHVMYSSAYGNLPELAPPWQEPTGGERKTALS